MIRVLEVSKTLILENPEKMPSVARRAMRPQNTGEVPMRRFSNQNRKVAWRDALFLGTRTMGTRLGDWLYR